MSHIYENITHHLSPFHVVKFTKVSVCINTSFTLYVAPLNQLRNVLMGVTKLLNSTYYIALYIFWAVNLYNYV